VVRLAMSNYGVPEWAGIMIYTQSKRYQVALWAAADRSGVAEHAEFGSREEAERAFEASKREGRYRSGILFEWNKHQQDWTLIDRYP